MALPRATRGLSRCAAAAVFGLALISCSDAPSPAPWALAIHGGAGGLPKDLPAAEVQKIREALEQALASGGALLETGGSSLDAVQAAVRVMEGSGVLNAGRGPVLNHEGHAELDAAIMNGKDRAAGSVAGVRHVANPIDLARLVMDRSRHVLLVGAGAEAFAKEQGIELKPDEYFVTERRRRQLERDRQGEREAGLAAPSSTAGTVGAIALDRHGNLAAATSTGGMSNKHAGRVGDSPIIGAGTFAQNGVCAVSATGHGEYFIRYTAAAEVCARVRLGKLGIDAAARQVIDELKEVGGEGGLIAMDARGRIARVHSSPTMLSGRVSASAPAQVVVETR